MNEIWHESMANGTMDDGIALLQIVRTGHGWHFHLTCLVGKTPSVWSEARRQSLTTMHGMYVNSDAQLVLVCDNKDHYIVYMTNDADGGSIMNVKNKSKVELDKSSNVHTGFYNGDDCILWEDGSKWRRLEMSMTQYRIINARPYIPLTLTAIAVLKMVTVRMFKAIVSLYA